jgi:hypothetical protein
MYLALVGGVGHRSFDFFILRTPRTPNKWMRKRSAGRFCQLLKARPHFLPQTHILWNRKGLNSSAFCRRWGQALPVRSCWMRSALRPPKAGGMCSSWRASADRFSDRAQHSGETSGACCVAAHVTDPSSRRLKYWRGANGQLLGAQRRLRRRPSSITARCRAAGAEHARSESDMTCEAALMRWAISGLAGFTWRFVRGFLPPTLTTRPRATPLVPRPIPAQRC